MDFCDVAVDLGESQLAAAIASVLGPRRSSPEVMYDQRVIRGVAQQGDTVTLDGPDGRVRYTLVQSTLGLPQQACCQYLSAGSALGRELLGQRQGATVTVVGETYTLVNIEKAKRNGN